MRAFVSCLVVVGSSCFSPSQEAAVRTPTRLEVHEWGTFTSMSAPDGTLLEGLHHEEERLPAFVHGRNTEALLPASTRDCSQKCLEASRLGGSIAGVTQKLETPVIYFSTDVAQTVSVRVRFPGGVISEWYPQATSYGPELGQWQRLADGHMRWDVALAPGTTPVLPQVAVGNPWPLARGVGSVALSVGNEHEEYIFYRGLGAFPLALTATTSLDGTLRLSNASPETVPAAFLLHVHEGGGALVSLGALDANTPITVPLPMSGKERSLDRFAADAMETVRQSLESAGLTAAESKAMVETWSTSYFKSKGTRVLYVVPREWTDALLPMELEPAPTRLVRVLVGRLELFTAKEEQGVAQRVGASMRDGTAAAVLRSLGRFAEPKLRRVCHGMNPLSAEGIHCGRLLSDAQQAP